MMDIKTLAVELEMDVNDLLIKVVKLNKEHDLGIDEFDKLDRVQHDVIRASLDTAYLVKLIRGEKSDRKYNYQNAPDYHDLMQWMSKQDLRGLSTKEIKEMLPEQVTHRGFQTISAAMRSIGYECKVTYLGEDRQGRRWSKAEEGDVSFL